MHRRCVNQAHLEAVTSIENVRRSTLTEVNRNAAKTHCLRGHEFTEKTTYRSKTSRQCRTCMAEAAAGKHAHDRDSYLQSQREYYAANAEALRAKKKAYDDANRVERNRKARERYRQKLSRPVDA